MSDPITPDPNPNPTDPDQNETAVDQVVKKRIGSYVKKTRDAEEQRDEAVTKAMALQAELELKNGELQRFQLQEKEKDLETKYPLAAEHLKKFPNLGLTATSPEDYEVKLSELNAAIAGTTPATPAPQAGNPQQPAAPAQPAPAAPISAPVGNGGVAATLPPNKLVEVSKLPQQDYAKLSKAERDAILRGTDEVASQKR